MRELGRSDAGDVALTDGFYNISILKRRDSDEELGINHFGITIEDIRVVGCYYEAGCNAQRNKTVDVKADDVRISHVEITQRGGRNGDAIQCVLVGSDHQLSGLLLEFSKSHSCGSEASASGMPRSMCVAWMSPFESESRMIWRVAFSFAAQPISSSLTRSLSGRFAAASDKSGAGRAGGATVGATTTVVGAAAAEVEAGAGCCCAVAGLTRRVADVPSRTLRRWESLRFSAFSSPSMRRRAATSSLSAAAA